NRHHMKSFLLNGRIIPKWIILLVDMLIISWSFSLSYFVVLHFDFSFISRDGYLLHTSLVCLLAFPIIYLYRLHTGLLRYSNTQDMLRIFTSVLTFSILTLFVEFAITPEASSPYITQFASLLIINFFITAS